MNRNKGDHLKRGCVPYVLQTRDDGSGSIVIIVIPADEGIAGLWGSRDGDGFACLIQPCTGCGSPARLIGSDRNANSGDRVKCASLDNSYEEQQKENLPCFFIHFVSLHHHITFLMKLIYSLHPKYPADSFQETLPTVLHSCQIAGTAYPIQTIREIACSYTQLQG